jgi:hypothetical protein
MAGERDVAQKVLEGIRDAAGSAAADAAKELGAG